MFALQSWTTTTTITTTTKDAGFVEYEAAFVWQAQECWQLQYNGQSKNLFA